jgi:15-cis-phytoene desaturase
MGKRVIVLGGGVGGMSAAHELAERGFEVTVYETRPIPGGKARSVSVPGSGTSGRRDLPGEHGFRFFPGFYRHLPDTMKRIPIEGQPDGVFGNLVAAKEVQIARTGGSEILSPAHFPDSLRDLHLAFDALFTYATGVGIPVAEQLYFVDGFCCCSPAARRVALRSMRTRAGGTFRGPRVARPAIRGSSRTG